MHLSRTRLLVSDFAASFRFYSQTLRLPVSFGTQEGPSASFDAGHDTLAPYGRGMMEDAVGRPRNTAERGSDQFLLGFIEDVDEATSQLVADGVAFVSLPTDQPLWQIGVAHFRHPEGNLVELSGPLKGQGS